MSELPRHLLEKYFGDDPRLVAAFEDQAAQVEANTGEAAAAVEATNAIKDAVVIVLSENSEFTNERVLKVSDDIDVEITASEVRLKVKDCARTQDHEVLLVPTGDSELGIPETGTLVSDKAVPTLGNFANDAAAAGGGVGVGEMYRNGSALMVRVV